MKTLGFGNYAIGVFTEFESTAWKNDPSKFNHHIIISQEYQDRYGNPQTEVLRIEVMQDDVQAIGSQVTQLRGKQVVCPVRHDMKKFGDRSWMAVTLPRQGLIYPYETVIKTDSK